MLLPRTHVRNAHHLVIKSVVLPLNHVPPSYSVQLGDDRLPALDVVKIDRIICTAIFIISFTESSVPHTRIHRSLGWPGKENSLFRFRSARSV